MFSLNRTFSHAPFLRQKIGEEDGDDGERGYVADEEPEDTEELGIGAEGATVGEFVVDVCFLESPAYEEDCKETAEGHHDICFIC